MYYGVFIVRRLGGIICQLRQLVLPISALLLTLTNVSYMAKIAAKVATIRMYLAGKDGNEGTATVSIAA